MKQPKGIVEENKLEDLVSCPPGYIHDHRKGSPTFGKCIDVITNKALAYGPKNAPKREHRRIFGGGK